MYYDIFKKLNKLDEKYELTEIFEIHSGLNQKLFDHNLLREDIRKQLIKIADMFVDSIKEDQIPIKVYDYWLVGSNAAYNYSDNSDIDVHIIVDINSLGLNPYLISLLYNYIKSSFNDKYDIKVKGHEVELYLEDIETSAVTNGIYSLKQDKWIKEPIRNDEVEIYDVTETELYQNWYERYQSLNDREAEQFLDNLYMMRKMSLANEGEFGVGNLVFKEFRNQGYLDSLKDRKYKYKSKELTLENLEEDFEPVFYENNKVKGIYKLIGKNKSTGKELDYYYISQDFNSIKNALSKLNKSKAYLWGLVCNVYMKDKDDGKYDYVDTIEFDKYSIDTKDTLKEYQRKYHNKIYPSNKFSNVYKIEKL